MLKKLDYRLLVVLAFLLVYIASLTFVYIEGDDASTILYHALGRNEAVQSPYSPYHGMMDVFLSIFPASEPVLRVVAFTTTAVFACVFYMLVMQLAFQWFEINDRRRRNIIAILFLLASPEFFFFGLVYTPSVVGMSLVMLAHLLVRRNFFYEADEPAPSGHYTGRYWMALVLFGLGASCRWDTMIYGSTIVLDLLLMSGRSPFRTVMNVKRSLAAIVWGVLALFSAYLFIVLSGYGLGDMLHILSYTEGSVEHQTKISVFLIVGFLSLFSPFTVATMLIGLIATLKRRYKFLIIYIVSLITASPFLYSGFPKTIIYFIPIIMAVAALGYVVIWDTFKKSTALKYAGGAVIAVSVLFLWFVGLKYYSDKAWGPGFELSKNEYDAEGKPVLPSQRYQPVIGPGLALPTQDGTRPVGGYAYVLLGGEWREFYNKLENEHENAVQMAIEQNMPLLQENNSALAAVVLVRKGYVTQDPRKSDRPNFQLRTFTNERDTVQNFLMTDKNLLYSAAALDDIMRTSGKHRVVLYAGYSSTVSDLLKDYSTAFTYTGPFSGVLDLAKLKGMLSSDEATDTEQ